MLLCLNEHARRMEGRSYEVVAFSLVCKLIYMRHGLAVRPRNVYSYSFSLTSIRSVCFEQFPRNVCLDHAWVTMSRRRIYTKNGLSDVQVFPLAQLCLTLPNSQSNQDNCFLCDQFHENV